VGKAFLYYTISNPGDIQASIDHKSFFHRVLFLKIKSDGRTGFEKVY